MKNKSSILRHWYARFAMRITFYGLALGLVLWGTASRFDATEITAWLFFIAIAIGFEGVLAVQGGQWPTKKSSGRIDVAFVLMLACVGSAASIGARRSVDEVVTIGSFAEHERAVLEAFQ